MMRDDTFVAQRDAGVHWLHVHPSYLAGPTEWEIVRLARAWSDGMLPEAGGVADQAAWTVAAIEVVNSTFARMRAALFEKQKEN